MRRTSLILPYNMAAERSILSILIHYPDNIAQTETQLTLNSFYISAHKIIYKSLLRLYETSQQISTTTLLTYIQDYNLFSNNDEFKELITIVKKRESAFHLKSYIILLQDKYIRRQLITLGEKLIEWGYLSSQPLEKVLNKAELEFSSISEQYNPDKLTNSAEILIETLEELQMGLIQQNNLGIGYLSQYPDLDTILQGFQNSDIIILAGRPSMGKTALALNFAKNIAEIYQLPVVFFSLEMSKKQVMYRLLSMEAFVDNTKLKLGKITKTEWFRIVHASNKLAKLPIYIEDNSLISLVQIKNIIKKIIREYKKIALVIIDYLQLIRITSKSINRVQEIAYATRTLKSIAKEYRLPLLVLSQLSRNVESRVNKRPMLSDLRESGCFKNDLKNKIPLILGKEVNKFNNNLLQKFTGKKIYYSFNQVFFSHNHKINNHRGWLKLREIFYTNNNLKLSYEFSLLYFDQQKTINFLNFGSVWDFFIPSIHNGLKNQIIIHNSIEQDADVVLMLYREDYYKPFNKKNFDFNNQVELIIAKHRNGPVGFVDLFFDASINKFFSI